jgi:hypothetical protein
MKYLILVLVLVAISSTFYGQQVSTKVDSLTKSHIKLLAKDKRNRFNEILKQRSNVNLFQRIDTTNYDYLFIQENYCIGDTEAIIAERYFFEEDRKKYVDIKDGKIVPGGVLPWVYFFNGKVQEVNYHYYSSSIASTYFSNIFEYYFTLDTLLSNFANLKPVQKLTFDSTLATSDISDTSSTYRFKREQIAVKRLKSTYQILTKIDRINKSVTVSVQLPADNPKVKIRYVMSTHYDW